MLDGLRRQSALLVLDNLEHLPGAAGWVAEWLRAAPGVQMLVTSRGWLDLREEVVFTVPPLALPAGDSMQQILASPAVALFAERAAHHGRPLDAGDDDRRAAAEICCRLDGLPLAIELVAPRLRVMTPPVLAARLQRRLDLLTGGAADALPHHRSLRQALDWSHDLLDERERMLFRRLGVFVGGWSLAAADAMTGDAAGAWQALEGLLRHHLVQRAPDVGAEPRFVMLETIREFALEALAASDEGAHGEQVRTAWVADWLASLQDRLEQGQRLQALALYRAERGNVRAALRWAFHESGDRLLQARLVTRLVEAWYYDNDAESGEAWFGRLDLAALPGPWRARVLLVGANLANHRCDFDRAAQRAQQAAEQAGADGDPRTEALAWCQQGKACFDPEAALALLRRGQRQLQRLGAPRDAALASWWLGKRLAQEGGRDAEAGPVLALARQHLLAVGDRWTAGVTLIQQALLAARRGDPLQARRHVDQGEAVAMEHDDSVSLATATHLRARFELADGRIEHALRLEHRTLELLLAEGEARIAVQHCRWLAHLHAARGEQEPAVRLMAASAGRYGDERFLSLTTVSADDRSDWLQAAQALRHTLPPATYEHWWQESLPWSPAQALALSVSLLDGSARAPI
ncbi:MAG: hypothetical protein IPM99_16365 [Rubrivivax sp.]|nr:hypothetical protein [Rubrivivax sp.]